MPRLTSSFVEVDTGRDVPDFTFDSVSSDALSPPTPASVTLDKVSTDVQNNSAGFGQKWELTLPNGATDGQAKYFTCTACGNSNTGSIEFVGMFFGGNTRVRFNSMEGDGVLMAWDGAKWFVYGAASPTYS